MFFAFTFFKINFIGNFHFLTCNYFYLTFILLLYGARQVGRTYILT